MTNDLENATKAAQTAALLCSDLHELVKSENLLFSDIAIATEKLEQASELCQYLEQLQDKLKAMETT